MRKYCSKILLLLISNLIAQDSNSPDTVSRRIDCATPSSTEEQILQTRQIVENWLSDNRDRPEEQVHILVAFHVLYASDGTGNISNEAIYDQFEWLNLAYEPHNIYFTVDTINRVENDEWFNNWYGQDSWAGMSQLAIDPYHYLNAYSANLWIDGINANGWAYLGQYYEASDYRQSISLAYQIVQYGHDTATHEVGHHLGLSHTFQDNCSAINDGVDDTPAMHYDGTYSCNEMQDTCPDDEGFDPVRNYMNYASQECRNNFSQGQDNLMSAVIASNHMGYYENTFQYPSLSVSSVNIENDTDGDLVLNPSDTAKIRFEIENSWGAFASGVYLTLSSEDERLIIIDSTIQFSDTLFVGDIASGPNNDLIQIHAIDGFPLGKVDCNLNVWVSNEDYPYEIDIPIELSISLNQRGFPIEGMVIKSSPIIADLDNNNTNDVFYGSDNGGVYGFMVEGLSMFGFPFSTDGDVRSSPAVADLENDGSNEIMFGSNDGTLYVLNSFGVEVIAYQQSGMINGSPAVIDLDQDGDREIIFVSYNGTNSDGEVYAIHHDGSEVDGFPVDLDERMMAGPAAGDLDGDGHPEIVVCTWGENIYSIGHDGSIKSGFPFESTKRFNAPATLVDLDGDSDLEIIAGNDDGLLHILHHDGTEMASYDVGDDIRGGISVADLNDDGSYELLFTGYDDMIHVWNPIDGAELEGWPVDMESNSLTEPVTADLDNDGDLEVVTARKSGMAYVFHHDATPYNNFPASLGGNVESSPAIGDIDGDGDFELVFGTTGGLKVIDIKEDMGERMSWKLHRGNLERTGSLGMTLVKNDFEGDLNPMEFYVSSNYPNPFNPSTMIDIETVEAGDLIVNVFDAKGRMINNLVNSYLEAGRYSVKWNGMDLSGMSMPTGVYFIQVQSGLDIHTQKMILMK